MRDLDMAPGKPLLYENPTSIQKFISEHDTNKNKNPRWHACLDLCG